ncbi:GMC family oxidoreductase [Brachymonas denitrificans]|uniref:GMC family oxidoreductase n=1 Tax=Brachymonas denitrificans TaxID=28220 RepID=UPI001BCFA9BF|nr:choline dehydrogenase [Brachymonas denitrificans]
METDFDYIVVGGGSAGSVLAGRLSEHAGTRVCLLEAGGGGSGPAVNIPCGAVTMLPTRYNNWAFESVPQPGLNGRRAYQPRGKCLGGSSAINAMIYIRGHRHDYDHWAALGNAGWSYDDVLPYFILSENNERYRDRWHGNSGPLHVSDLRSDSPFHARYLEAARQAGLPLAGDFNGAEQEGVGLYQVTQKDGERWSAARAYLLPHIGQRANLAVHTRAAVQRIVFEGRRAVGVDVLLQGQRHRLHARREVLLSAGALQSPQLLMLSGVGDGALLQQHGIASVHHLPGVGRNLQDHLDFTFGYNVRGVDSFGFSSRGSWRMLRELLQFRRARRGMLTTNFAEGGGFLKSRPELPIPDLQLHFVVALVDSHARKLHWGHGLSCHVCLLRPQSRGTVGLQGADPALPPRIDPAYLSHPQDLEDMVAGYRITQRLMQAPALAELYTRDMFTADVRDDEGIRAIIRQRAETIYHPVGTCRMGTDADAVVDAELRVHGLQGLRVVDASIMPTLIGGNTNAPTIMIAEKAVDLIRGQSRIRPGVPHHGESVHAGTH